MVRNCGRYVFGDDKYMDAYDDVVEALEKKFYKVSYFEKAEDARNYLDSEIDECTVGFGDSQTMAELGLYDALSKHNMVFDPLQSADNDEFLAIAKRSITTDVFLTSVNALSRQGEMVNIDGTGNRVAGSLFGHKKIYFVVGTNKIAEDLEEAIKRARNIAGPRNAYKYLLRTPCVAVGGQKCFDCKSPERICNAMVVYFRKMNDIDEVEVVLINEKLGF